MGAGGPHHRPHQHMASSSLDCHRLVLQIQEKMVEIEELQKALAAIDERDKTLQVN